MTCPEVLYHIGQEAIPPVNASGIGAELRRARLAKGLSLEEISGQTRITVHFLDAIEQGNFEELPGLLFMRNFVRQYASAVSIDPKPLLAALPEMDDTLRKLPEPPRHPRARRRTALGRGNSFVSYSVWVLVALGAGLAAWSHFHPQTLNFLWPRVSAAAAPAPPPAKEAAPQPLPEPQAQPSETHATPSPRPVEVVVTAIQSAWVQLSADGKPAFSGTLQPNESREVSADEKVKIVAGNAGGLTVSLNGKKLDSLGPAGQVRVVTLTAAGPELPPPSHPPTAPDRL
jgi:cytoskeletal protein RodZ